jgi:hypothetical protein
LPFPPGALPRELSSQRLSAFPDRSSFAPFSPPTRRDICRVGTLARQTGYPVSQQRWFPCRTLTRSLKRPNPTPFPERQPRHIRKQKGDGRDQDAKHSTTTLRTAQDRASVRSPRWWVD